MPKPVYTLRAFISSFSEANKKYTIKKKDDGTLTCSCPAWIFNHSGNRNCKHLQAITGSGDQIEKLFILGSKYVLDIDGEKWEIIKDMTPNGPIKKEVK